MTLIDDTEERLRSYYPFSQDVVDVVATTADYQTIFSSYKDYFDRVGITDTVKFQPEGYLPVEILDIRPKEHDPKAALLIHLAMANPLNPNQMFQIATIADTNPNKRIIAVGNPSGGHHFQSGRLSRIDRANIADGVYMIPLVDPLLKYTDKEGIESVEQMGFSYGALRAVASAVYADHEVTHTIPIEPVVGQRSLAKLGWDFMRTGKALKGYVKASDSELFNAARKDSLGGIAYARGVARLSNIAIAKVLAHADFEEWTDMAMVERRQMKTTIIWGSESELATDAIMQEIVRRQSDLHPGRVTAMRLRGQKHNMVNDVSLQAALMLEALKAA